MSQLRAAIIAHIRAHLDTALTETIQHWSEAEMTRRMFVSHSDGRGLRLTQFGEQLMHHCFQSYEFETGELSPAMVIFLAERCKMPYFHAQGKLVVYDKHFAVMLRLVGGNLVTMSEIDSV